MSTRSTIQEILLPSKVDIQRKLMHAGWSTEVQTELIPLIGDLGEKVLSPEDLAQAVLVCVSDAKVKVSFNELNLILALLCESTGQAFLREAMGVVRDLRLVAQQPPHPKPVELS